MKEAIAFIIFVVWIVIGTAVAVVAGDRVGLKDKFEIVLMTPLLLIAITIDHFFPTEE